MDESQQALFEGFKGPEKEPETPISGTISGLLRPILIKDGVVFKRFTHEVFSILPILADVFNAYGKDCIITSANDGIHKVNSKHYLDLALDIRTKHLLDSIQKHQVYEALKKRLGNQYVVLLEKLGEPGEHIHIGYVA